MPHNKPALTADTRPALRFAPDVFDQIMRLGIGAEGVLSVYLDIEPEKAQREGFEAALLDLWKPVRAAIKGSDLTGRLEEEIDRVTEYVRSWDEPPGRAVAFFSSAPRDAFMPVVLDVPVLAGARFGPRPYLVPLIAALDEHERFCVALVDKESARILTVWMGRIEQRVEFEDEVPGRSAMGNWAQARYARHREYHVHLHMQRVIDELWRLSRRRAFDRLIVGGPEEAMAALRPLLPRSLAEKVAGEFTGERFASDAEIVERVRRIEERAERAHETALVERILERAPKRARAVLGWDETLIALSEGSVHVLALAEGATTPGFACPEGHMAVQERIDRCPFCEEPMWPVDDLAVSAARLAVASGATVEFLRGDAAERLRPHGAGALLRY